MIKQDMNEGSLSSRVLQNTHNISIFSLVYLSSLSLIWFPSCYSCFRFSSLPVFDNSFCVARSCSSSSRPTGHKSVCVDTYSRPFLHPVAMTIFTCSICAIEITKVRSVVPHNLPFWRGYSNEKRCSIHGVGGLS